jgi:hypothetical protein
MRKNILLICAIIFTQILLGQNFNDTKKRAKQGNETAQYYLATMYDLGNGALTNKKKAFYWYKKSAEQGYAKAQLNVAYMYYFGDGTLINKKQAVFWTKKSYENGFEKAIKFWKLKELWKY